MLLWQGLGAVQQAGSVKESGVFLLMTARSVPSQVLCRTRLG